MGYVICFIIGVVVGAAGLWFWLVKRGLTG